ncbi:glycoside hydrolase family 73 protein [Roseivivax sediminis]|uniref:Flagellum-specific peptidoglycan hydrolase FlgJ n=1 Tax=Roseivivax sediminis TaxID=936889 RepID=A0A1I1U9F2_9RHOB|nr:glucosaminidase domain-containing protein [Roseivivax sediminis]SFD67482.1 Flagellum-specific peptidoglycan hydrolase FlgJ [Roseivivax sediminis]
MNREDFIAAMMPHAQRVSQATGIDPRIVIAQSALETGWGKSAPGNNYFGIKSHGQKGGGTYNTWEVIDGKRVNISDSFRGYGSMGESADDYGRFLQQNKRYRPMLNAQGLDAQINALAESGYATDPQYGSKIRSIASSISGGGGSNAAPTAPQTTRTGSDGGDTLLSTQGGPMVATASQRPPAGLLAVPEESAGEPLLGGLLGDWFTPDKRDRLILALEGMTLNPNKALMATAAGGIEDRQEGRKEAQAERKEVKRKNQTIEWLNAQGDYGRRLAQAVSAGGLSASEAVKLAMTSQEGPKPTDDMREYELARQQGFSGSLQDWLDRGQGGDESASDASIRRIMEAYGVDQRTAVGIVDGTLKVSRDPVDDTVIVTDLATRQSYRPQMPDDTGQPAQTQQQGQPESPRLSFPGNPGADASDAFGLEGMLKSGANAASDFLGMGAPFEGVRETQSDFDVLRESLINDVASSYPRQPPAWLLKNIQDLTPQAGSFQGAGSAQSKLGALRRNFENELNTTQEQLGRRMSPAERQELLARKTGLEAAISKVDSYLGRFGGGESKRTGSGVEWSVVE